MNRINLGDVTSVHLSDLYKVREQIPVTRYFDSCFRDQIVLVSFFLSKKWVL